MKKNYHVVPRGSKWAVVKGGFQRASSLEEMQNEAFGVARGLATKSKSEVLIHGKDGKIRGKHSYGNDPYPPKG
ncbi:MAG: DUF2188 domain-containing protein [Tenuifilaceae bacterium]|jgi:hypothetical protein|nr:DUF2188 domain-containing protein [Tenuifilaceae bacterium]